MFVTSPTLLWLQEMLIRPLASTPLSIVAFASLSDWIAEVGIVKSL